MILILLILFVTGFFFPPAWLALGGYAIYAFASRKSRRDDAVESRIKKMISAGIENTVFSDLYFDAARSYAIEKGAQSPEQDAASATIILNGRTYFVIFMRDSGGGTRISIRDGHVVESEVERDLKERLETYGTKRNLNKATECLNNTSDASQFADGYIKSIDLLGEIGFDRLNMKPSWGHNNEKVREFTSFLMDESIRSGVAETYSVTMPLQKDFFNLIFSCVATAECQGFDFNFQKQVGVEIVKICWGRLSEEKRNMIRNVSLSSEDLEKLSEQ